MNNEEMIQLLKTQGFTAHCSMDLIDLKDEILITVNVEEKHLNPFGIVHGGMFYTMCDTVSGILVSHTVGPSVTLNSNFNFLGNVSSGKVIAKAKMVRSGKTISIVDTEVYSENDQLLARGTFTYFINRK